MHQLDERRAGQRQGATVLDRLGRGRAGRAVQERHLPEYVRRAYHGEHRPLAGRRGAEHRHRTAAQDDQGLAGIVLHEQQLTLAVRARDRRGDHPLPDFGLQSGEHVHAGQRVARVRQPYLHEPTLPK